MLSKLQEFVDNMKRFLDQKTTSAIAAPAPTETAPPPPRTAVPNISTVEDNSRIEAGPTKKGTMAAALAMTLQRLNNVQAANDATARDVAIRQSDREAAAEAHRIESAARLADEKNLLNFKETLPSNMDARATNKAYREAMTRNANLGADLKQARLSGTMPTAGRGGKSGSNVPLPQFETEEQLNELIKKASGKALADLTKKKNALYGKDSPYKTDYVAGSNPNDGFVYGVLIDKKTGKMVGTNGLIKKATNINAMQNMINQQIDSSSGSPAGPPQINNVPVQPQQAPQPAAPQTLRKPKTKEEYQQMRQTMTKEQIEALPD